MATPLVSILVPSYNYARFLPEALDSAVRQSVRDLEIVVIDDASTDDSVAVLDRYASTDSRVRVARRATNVGMVANWNACLEKARGTYVQFLLADDALGADDAVETLVRLLEQQPEATLAVGARTIVDEHSRPLRVKGYARRSRLEPGPSVIARCVAAGSNLIGEPDAVLFRRADAARGFDPRYRQLIDLEMWFHLLRRGAMQFSDRSVCNFRRHALQQSSVNRGTGVHQRELALLLDEYVDTTAEVDDRQLLAGWSYRLRRHEPTERMRRAAALIDRRLGPGRHLARLRFRLSRPLANLNRRRRARPR